jgi:uncharacterized protein YgiM (DUF1202 family)
VRGRVFIALGLAAAALAAGPARAEESWARGAPLDLRSGGTLGHRVLGTVAPGERLDVLTRSNGWARVRTPSGKEGWVVEAQIDALAPPRERVGVLEEETARLRAQVAGLEAERDALRSAAGELEGREAERTGELDRLLRQNAQLAAGVRWIEWLTGAGLLAVGMGLGALVRGFMAGRRATRIRL